jgi:hypothetical protein
MAAHPTVTASLTLLLAIAGATTSQASGHGPVFGAATPTLGRGGWSIDQAWTIRLATDDDHESMLKTMVSYGVTENVQVSGSLPLATSDGQLHDARMMSLMSNGRDFEGLIAYRFQRRVIGIGGRQESTVYAGGRVPFERRQRGSLEIGAATGYASRAHYVWGGALIQRGSQLLTAVYGYRPAALRTEAGRPDLRFFIEATAEHRETSQTVFVGPTALLLHKAVGIEAGVLFPAHQSSGAARPKEHARIAVNVAYFFWLK